MPKKYKVNIISNIFIVLVISTVFLLSLGSISMISQLIRSFYTQQIESEAKLQGLSVQARLDSKTVAQTIISDIIRDRMESSAKIATYFATDFDQALMEELSDNFHLDVIYWYDENANVLSSLDGEYIGWQAYPGHPVYNFWISNLDYYVEDIRADSETGVLYQYAYARVNDGRFIQVGILAEKIEELVSYFSVQQLVEEMSLVSEVKGVFFVSQELEVKFKNSQTTVTYSINSINEELHRSQKMHINYNTDYLAEKELVEIIHPIYIHDEFIGSFVILRSFANTQSLVNNTILVGLCFLFFIIFLISYMLYQMWDRNRKLQTKSYFDELTKLPNKAYLTQFMTSKLVGPQNKSIAYMMVTISQLNHVNLALGYEEGNRMIKDFVKVFQSFETEHISLYRIEGHRFLFVISSNYSQDKLQNMAERLTDFTQEMYKHMYIPQYVSLKVGIIETSKFGMDTEIYLKKLGIAISQISPTNSIRYCFYNEEMESILDRNEIIVKELQEAISDPGQKIINIHFQPILDLKTGNVASCEVLARMNSPMFGNVSPEEFIDVAERNHLIAALGYCLFTKACESLKVFDSQLSRPIKLSLNVSLIQLMQDDFIEHLIYITQQHQVDIRRFDFEITESVISEDFETINSKLKKIKDLGCLVALDDFGIGHSSLARLRELNINHLKIDRSFTRKIKIYGQEKTLITDIVSMAHRLNYQVIAEGIENHEELLILEKLDCDFGQGYYFSKPLILEEMIRWIVQQRKKLR